MNAEDADRLILHEFGRMAEFYNRCSITGKTPVWRRIHQLVPLSPGARVLDVACGPGAHTVRLARVVGPTGLVVGVDAAKGVIDFARRRSDGRGLHNLRFERMNARKLRLPDRSFDLVLSIFGISYLDRRRCLEEVYRVLDTDGRFLYVTWSGQNPESKAFSETLSELRRERPPPPDVLRLAEAREMIANHPENRAGSPKLVTLLREVGFRRVHRVIRDVTVSFPSVSAYVRLKATWGEYYRDLHRLSPRERRRFVGAVARRMEWPLGGRGPTITWSLSFTMARKS